MAIHPTGTEKPSHRELRLDGPGGAPDPGKPPRAGDPCPQCSTGRLDYDCMLNLACPECGYALAGCFT